ncbi:MAG: hypothetical protein ACJ797_07855 [Ktedonobacteraceae bacterium]
MVSETGRLHLPHGRKVWRGAQRAPGSLPVSSGALFRADLPDLVGNELSEPDTGSVDGSRRDADELALGRGDGEFGDDACRGDAPDLVRTILGEVEISAWPNNC